MMPDDSFFSFDDDEKPVILTAPTRTKVTYLVDPREVGGVFLQSLELEREKCSVCNSKLTLEVFYFSGKSRKFVKCCSCDEYLFEIGKHRR